MVMPVTSASPEALNVRLSKVADGQVQVVVVVVALMVHYESYQSVVVVVVILS